MDREEPGQSPESTAGAAPSRPVFSLRRRSVQLVSLALFACAVGAGVLFTLRDSIPICDAQDLGKNGGKRELFAGWGKPDVALLLSGQMHGYLQPCGCSFPQYGGMARRYNFLQSLKDRGWPVVLVDLGDLAQKGGPQAMLKYTTAMQALHLMDYTAVALGKNEMDMPLIDALANYALNSPAPNVLAANLLDPKKQFQDMVRPWVVTDNKNMPVGVVALIGPNVAGKVKDDSIKFADNRIALKNALKEAAKKATLIVLLYEGSLDKAKASAEFWAREQQANPNLPQIHVIQCLSEEEEEEPPSLPVRAGNSLVIAVGHKGRNVGVVGAFRTGKANPAFELRYQLVRIGPEYETPKEKAADNPVAKLMEEYTKELKDRDYLARYPRNPHHVQLQFPKARYVGSARCGECHESAYKVWEKSKHAEAYQTLVDARDPKLRQFDGECVVCHVVGFNHPTGFYDQGNKKGYDELLKNVGCESCHGPGSEHVKNPANMAIYPFINPWKAKVDESPAAAAQRLLRVDTFCQKCHDIDNDTHWNFQKNWPQIIHMTPRKAGK